eukprot:2443787-Rhodomonas_salina.1
MSAGLRHDATAALVFDVRVPERDREHQLRLVDPCRPIPSRLVLHRHAFPVDKYRASQQLARHSQ